MLLDGDDERPRSGGAASLPALTRFAAARVLLIDDEQANLTLLHQLLTRAGLSNLHVLADSRDAMARIDELEPDLVLLDLHMPQVDGYAILTELRERAKRTHVPVLVLSADSTRHAITRALDLGARDFLTKPFDLAEATLRVRNLLETQSLYTTLRHHNVSLRDQIGDLERAADSAHASRAAILDRVTRVLDRGDLSMVFQPIVEVPGRTVVGCEALARFPADPITGAVVGPDQWFADADTVGLGTELEIAAVAAALRHLPQLPEHVFLAVNVSPWAALSPELTVLLEQVDRKRIVLELTEHVQVQDYEAVSNRLGTFRDQGARLALDDTGAGYAGFRHLLGLRPDVIKLDISLTRDIDKDAVRRALAGALVTFAAEVDAQVIAEGVENEGELATLLSLHIPWVQGYQIARPGPMSDVVAMAAE